MKKRILVIEDEHEIALIIKMRLEISGYDVIQAFDGQDGLKKAKTSSPDLILLDLVLPKIGGEQILNELKDNDKYKSIPIIVVTGLSQDAFSIKDSISKADAYFLKPFDNVELLATIADFLKGSGNN
ncbi:MAG: response regulator transcription factor [Candidatus Omnitrophota bacterium]